MISNKVPHTYRSHGVKFYAFFENIEVEAVKGFHFYVFDENGYCYYTTYFVNNSFLRSFGNGFFLERKGLEADGLSDRYTLERYSVHSKDVTYALEIIHQALGLDLVLLKQSEGVVKMLE